MRPVVARALAWIEPWGEPVAAEPLRIRLADPDDLPFVEVAVTGRADALVTGNPRHFDVRDLAGTLRVVVPADLRP